MMQGEHRPPAHNTRASRGAVLSSNEGMLQGGRNQKRQRLGSLHDDDRVEACPQGSGTESVEDTLVHTYIGGADYESDCESDCERPGLRASV